MPRNTNTWSCLCVPLGRLDLRRLLSFCARKLGPASASFLFVVDREQSAIWTASISTMQHDSPREAMVKEAPLSCPGRKNIGLLQGRKVYTLGTSTKHTPRRAGKAQAHGTHVPVRQPPLLVFSHELTAKKIVRGHLTSYENSGRPNKSYTKYTAAQAVYT